MTPARLQRIEEIFYAALDQEPDHINAFLETTCEGDELLRGEVEGLLASRQRVGSFIETPAVGIATSIIRNGQADLLVGQTFGHYKISKRIGSGGMGEVYLASDMTAGRMAALKLLPMRFTGDAERLKRFQQEAHAVVVLNHPNILTVYEIGEDHSTHYIASELIEGETLRQRLARGRMELSEAVDIAIQVASALAAAHEAGIVHRDINPGNIMLRPDGYVKVLDFGIAKLAEQEAPATMPKDAALLLVETNLGSILGTVPYMSPEQACGAPVDKGTDLWSLGVVLYEMVTGHAPFIGDTPRKVMTSILEKEPSPLTSYIRQTPPELQQIASKTLRKDRTERYQSASEMLQALKNLRHKLESKAELERSTTPLWLRWARSPIALVLVLLMSALALAFPFYRHRNLPTSLPPEKSIAVLPFQNLSRDPDNAYFADGIQEEILTRLASIADLKVISRSSAQEYQSKPRNLREIAKQLGVANVLEGSVQRTADRVHINVQLIKAASDAHVWAEAYDRKLTDIFAVESEIAKTIAETLQAKLTGSEQRAIATRPTENTEAHQLYLKGRFFWNKRTSDGMMKSIDYFARAIEKDPAYGLAYAGLADAYTILPNYSQTPWNESYPRAKAAVLKALELDDNVAEAHIALANLKLWNDWAQGAEEEFKRGIELSPNYATGHHWYSIYLSAMGRHQEAIAEMTKAQALDPFSLIVNTQLGLPYLYAREYDRAITHFQKAIEMDPNFAFAHFALAEAYDRKGRYEDAFAEHDKSIALAGEPSQGWLAMTGLLKDTYQTLGGKDYWQKRLEVTRKLYEEHAVTPKAVAEIYAVVGDKEQALGWLEKSYQEHDRFLVFLKVQSEFDTLRGDPRFEALLAKVFSAQKSIAVLPFENRSEDKANEYFAEGIQDEILTRLSKIADLKVISRTSTQHYKSAPENLPEIAKQLGVAHILEGRVQKSGDAVRVNVQLIKAANGSHLWADTFDRKLTDIFSVESEVAKTIADQLQAQITGREAQVIAARPTDNPAAYDAYLRGLAYFLKPANTPTNSLPAQKYLRDAVGLDPKFALAWALLSRVDSNGYLTQVLQRTPALREEARQAADTALGLQPNLGEALHAKGNYHYGCLKDYDTAVRHFQQARQLLPNSSQLPESLAYVARRRGEWDRSEAYFNEAEQLDPRNVRLLSQHAASYMARRRFSDALRKFDDVLDITPDDLDSIMFKGQIAQAEGDLPGAANLLGSLHIPADNPGALETQFRQAILERRLEAAISRLREILAKPDPRVGFFNAELRFWLGWGQELAGDHPSAEQSWRQARNELEGFLKEQPENYWIIGALALANMALGDKAAALSLAERGMSANPVEKDAILGPAQIEVLARVAAQTGEPDHAIAALEKLLSMPYAGWTIVVPLTPALLRLDPMFDPLRNDPRFQKLCEEKPH